MSNLGPIIVFPHYDGELDLTTWHGSVQLYGARVGATMLTRDGVIAQLLRAVRRASAEAGPVQVLERAWHRGHGVKAGNEREETT